ncbi:MAG: D-aminopeptidase [Phycisphaerae bacterium]|nr:D-aminopeptidase [Phycisphaerae bacterium]
MNRSRILSALVAARLPAIALTCLLSATAQADEVAWPDTIAAQRARAFVDAFNGDDDAARKFNETHRSPAALAKRPMEQRVAQMRQMRATLGKLEPMKIVEHGSYKIDVVARAGKEFVAIRVELEAEPPHFLDRVGVSPAASPEAATRDYAAIKPLPELVETVRGDTRAPALAVAVVRGGKVVDEAVAGVRELKKPEKAELTDRFHIGSVTKSLTSTVVGRLIERGVLRWDLKLAEGLPGVEMREEYRDVTLEMLLQHRGGIRAYTDGSEDNFRARLAAGTTGSEARAQFAAFILNAEPVAKPGSSTNYSNAGYGVAAAIAERAAKKSWEELLEEIVFKPLELKAAGFGWPVNEQRRDQPRGHFGRGEALTPQPDGVYNLGAYLAPAGDVHCSIHDLALYAAAHLKGLRGEDGLLKAETMKRLHTPPAGADYACGWVIRKEGDSEVHWHNGSAGTFYAMVMIYPADDVALVAAANCSAEIEPTVVRMLEAIHDRR